MKKLLILAAIATILFSCSQEEPLQNENALENFYSSKLRTKEEVINIAQDFANEHQRGRSGARYVDESKVFTLDSHKSRSNSEPLMYVVEYEDNRGYAIVAAPKNVEPILAVIDEGSYQESINSGNPGFKFFMDAAEEYVSTTSIGGADPNPDGPNDPKPLAEYRVDVDTIFRFAVEPQVKVNRGQNYPEGKLCPNLISGCYPTALFMICEYFQEPKSIKLTFDNNQTINLPWNEMSKAISEPAGKNIIARLFPIESNPNYMAVAQLCRQIGKISVTNYSSPVESTTGSDRIHSSTKNILSSKNVGDYKAYNYMDIVNTLTSGGLVLCTGLKPNSNSGHAWVADGCEYMKTIQATYYREQGKVRWTLIKEEEAYYCLVYFNWGWNGDSNGVFSGDVFRPTETKTYSKELKMITIK